jgi:hypothetical protein
MSDLCWDLGDNLLWQMLNPLCSQQLVVNCEGFGQSIPDLEIVARFIDICRNALPLRLVNLDKINLVRFREDFGL